MPASAPPGEPLNLVVASSRIVAGQVRIELKAPASASARSGSRLLVKHAYRLQEDSRDREEYRFLLRSRLGDREHAPSLARFGDAYAIPQDVGGVLLHEHALDRPGEAVLAFEVGAEYTVGDWRSERVDVHDLRQARGEVRITVR